jgi:CheY-like chemotaxis protein
MRTFSAAAVKVLLVDDQSAALYLVQQALTLRGMEVATAPRAPMVCSASMSYA